MPAIVHVVEVVIDDVILSPSPWRSRRLRQFDRRDGVALSTLCDAIVARVITDTTREQQVDRLGPDRVVTPATGQPTD